MTRKKILVVYGIVLLLIIIGLFGYLVFGFRSPYLPDWRHGAVKSQIIDFVHDVSNPNSRHFVPQAKRIAVLDLDGTIMCEKPNYAIVTFSRQQFAKEVKTKQKSPKFDQNNDYQVELFAFEGMTAHEYTKAAYKFLTEYKVPRFNKPYVKLLYKPMLNLILFLQDNGFNVYIVTGDDPDFLRAVCSKYLHVAKDHVIGSRVSLIFKSKDGEVYFVRQPMNLIPINDRSGKPENIAMQIGVKPIFAVGNSNGDIGMLHMTASNKLPHLVLVIKHDDAKREYKYDGKSKILHKIAKHDGWSIVSMKNDFETIF
ncbi:MAG: haloacid dehalogenase-like hydrolase [Gammaproteobacteria bacterium]|nr:haloacid dehalogenase-like hydrolase [Gammaproteobacteria bacterium]